MAKTIIKEVIIALLLCLAILLVLAVLLYSYIPNNKVIPELVAYSVPDDAKQALTEAGADSSQVILTYEINSSDLSEAQKTNEYNPGKVNPFSSYKPAETTNETDGNTTADGSTTSGNTTAGSTNNSSSSTTTSNSGTSTSGGTTSSTGEQSTNSSTSGGTYFKDKGTK